MDSEQDLLVYKSALNISHVEQILGAPPDPSKHNDPLLCEIVLYLCAIVGAMEKKSAGDQECMRRQREVLHDYVAILQNYQHSPDYTEEEEWYEREFEGFIEEREVSNPRGDTYFWSETTALLFAMLDEVLDVEGCNWWMANQEVEDFIQTEEC